SSPNPAGHELLANRGGSDRETPLPGQLLQPEAPRPRPLTTSPPLRVPARRRRRSSSPRPPSQRGSEVAGSGIHRGMKLKTMFYAGLGFATLRVGKRIAKLKAKRVLHI